MPSTKHASGLENTWIATLLAVTAWPGAARDDFGRIADLHLRHRSDHLRGDDLHELLVAQLTAPGEYVAPMGSPSFLRITVLVELDVAALLLRTMTAC